MTLVLPLLFLFVILGLARNSLGWFTYVLMSLGIVGYMVVAYHAG